MEVLPSAARPQCRVGWRFWGELPFAVRLRVVVEWLQSGEGSPSEVEFQAAAGLRLPLEG